MKKIISIAILLLMLSMSIAAVSAIEYPVYLGDRPNQKWDSTFMDLRSPAFEYKFYPASLYYPPHVSFSTPKPLEQEATMGNVMLRAPDMRACRYAQHVADPTSGIDEWNDFHVYCPYTYEAWAAQRIIPQTQPFWVKLTDFLLAQQYR